MTLINRLVIAVCVLLFACALSHAQKKESDALDRAIKELQSGRTEKALAALDEVVKQYPTNADAYLLRGSLTMNENPTQALSDFNKVIELKPDSGPAYYQRAILRLISNDVNGALKDLDASIAHNFSDDSIYYLRGQLRGQLGELNAALSDLNEAIKLNPNNPGTYATRGGLLIDLKELDRALLDFNYLIDWYETDPSARPLPKPSDVKAANSQSQSRPVVAANSAPKPFALDFAQQTVNQAPGAKEMVPVITGAYINRGLILSSRGNHDGAVSDFGKAIRIDSKNVRAFSERANEYEFKGDLPAALEDIQQALQLDPKNGNLMVEHGVILLLLGRDKEAQTVFNVLLESDRALWQKRIDERIVVMRKLVPRK